MIQRVSKAKDHSFVSILETHGEYNPSLEYTRNSHSQISAMSHIRDGDLELVQFEIAGNKTFTLALAYAGHSDTPHQIQYGGKVFEWQGQYQLFER